MTIAIVQQNGTSSTTLNPTLRLNSVVAGHMLLACCLQAANAHPGVATSSRGDLFEDWGGAAGANLGFGLYRLRSAIGGNTTLSFPTAGPGAVAAMELSGVLADVGSATVLPWTEQPNDFSNTLSIGTTATLPVNPGTAGDLLLAFATSLGQTTYASPAGWTILRQVSNTSVSLCLATLTPAGTTNPVPVTFSTPTTVASALCVLALTPS